MFRISTGAVSKLYSLTAPVLILNMSMDTNWPATRAIYMVDQNFD